MSVRDNVGGIIKSVVSVFSRFMADTTVEPDSEGSLRSALHEAITKGYERTNALAVAAAYVGAEKEGKRFTNTQVKGLEGPDKSNKFQDSSDEDERADVEEDSRDGEERTVPDSDGRELD